ncbi:MAG: hypothetical protein COY53_00625 [Elusimicrobia bacterium CG_4_10_14_0_8_um_filter_37_32]|nr:MAG: hypothetical protein COS17_02865 [Elusimicrobia bacterium CG02_land_8_20_14_3_00_37_13]PIZ14257.1 MAG: hypothetical protein COY53_00625 [Elusimicrobia bacterium CG_4_10_14_0_8_um_filter_37_32]
MHKIRKISLIIMAASFIFPFIYLYSRLFPKRIIPSGYEKYGISPAEYAVVLLGQEIVKQAKDRKIRGYLVGIETIKGPYDDPEIDSLKIDINLAIKQYDGWKVMASIEQVNEIKRRKEEDIKRKRKLIDAGLINPEDYFKFIIASSKLEIDFDAMAEWKYLPGSKENCQIVCNVVNRKKDTSFTEFSTNVSFTYPRYYSFYKRTQNIIKYGTYVSGGTFMLSFSYFIIMMIIVNKKVKDLLENILVSMETLENYIRDGSYPAADLLLRKQLDWLPANSDLMRIKTRLMTVTKNNPKRAEEAYIRYINLRTKLQQNVRLTEEEFEDLKNLPKYLEIPEITELIAKYEKYIRSYEISAQLKIKQEHIRMLIEGGELSKAQSELDLLYRDTSWTEYKMLVSLPEVTSHQLALPPAESFDNLRTEVEQKLKTSQEKFEEAKRLVTAGNIAESEKLLKELIKINKDLKEAEEILTEIDKSRKTEKLRLIPEKIGKEILVFKKDTITFARRDRGSPDVDINNPRISRDHHLKLCIVENKVIAEDQNSANGTYHHGGKITRAEIESGDIIDLAHSYKMTVHICRGREIVQSTLVSGTIPAEMRIDQRDIAEHQKISGLFIETDNKNIIVLISSPLGGDATRSGSGEGVPIAFKSIGIVYEKSGDCQICVNNEVLLLKTPDTCQIVCSGDSIDYKEIRYRIGV